MFRITRGYVLPATQTIPTKSDKNPYPVYSSQTKDNGLMGYYSNYLYEDAITWTTDGANAGTVNYRKGKFSFKSELKRPQMLTLMKGDKTINTGEK